MAEKLGVGIYGANGHQIHRLLANHPWARLVATAAFPPEVLTFGEKEDLAIRHYVSLDQLIEDEEVELISLCSPRRRDQAADALRCMEAGKHVYAEKPCAMAEEDLDALIAAVSATGQRFHEMAGTAFEQPYLAMRQLVAAGTIGTVVQVFAQKSYPYHDGRPQDEDVDGGIIGQASIHALRFVEHVAGQRIAEIQGVETTLGNPVAGGGLRIAAALMMTLANGGVASVIANYLNPKGFGRWGNEHLRVFGTKGFVEATDGGAHTRLVVGDEDRGPINTDAPGKDYFDFYVESLLNLGRMPLPLEEELHPTRMAIRAKRSAAAWRLNP
ncbi:MAG TPA: Gfo/Idh/MocA family oxidoreductase [Planctomycetota bacterium]|nr:Gfo/Idh/MocA family oxidoreductase [Planctomycetota bacterium]HRR79335.1 Gfo/Idh/MocA family oxidoreductase [Planctomycetota bacterium]HRT96957.1 Gfo/Idh/MocA family oxidoreductase [Planctomycetota bacterium]